ncbi:NAD(P)H-quinone oxidoreductase [Phreatobacter aquaticus]|uniref:NAD(P)H-quinone oxidoreductase n=1 Tax=Phreatobacter aquaticus TaxID=2570229 RepID=A0A4D7QR43_9HYPH|nr:NAD(P)H-quinone oxidoreductase [Phreatobacter aquaticus]QCK88463.1 NAD(P)H-quinone oxidoreductase [Phreatobacter aquaticus]
MTALPPTMTAIAIPVPGGPEALVPETRPMPQPGKGEILVRIAAAGVNRPDVLQRAGGYPPPKGASDIPGLEFSGEVVALGAGASRFAIGDKVCALVAGGGYAEYAVVDETNALPVPKGLSMAEAAGVPETFFTVWSNVFDRGGLKAGETILIHGGTSGIGVTAIQLAKAFGATVLTTAGSDEKCAAAKALGADIAINYRTTDYVQAVADATGKKGVDLILDMVGGDYVQKNLACVAADGRIVQIAFLHGSEVKVDLRWLMLKRITFTGSTLRIRDLAFKAALAEALKAKVWPLLEAGQVKVVMDSTYPLAEASKAHARMETNAHIGKIVLTV